MKGATQTLERSELQMRRVPKCWAVAQPLPSFPGTEPGQLAKEDHPPPGEGLLPCLRAGILIPLSPSPRSQASQSPLATDGMEEEHGTPVASGLRNTEATVVSLCLVVGGDDDS